MKEKVIDYSLYKDSFTLRNRILRLIWHICAFLLIKPFFIDFFGRWRNFVLKLWGVKIGKKSLIKSSVRIWAPWNLEIGDYSTLGDSVKCYNQGKIIIGSHTTISQGVHLCASSHDYNKQNFPLTLNPIYISDQVWIAADVFIGPDVKIGEGAIIGARSAVFKNVEEWTISGGNPARPIKKRIISKE